MTGSMTAMALCLATMMSACSGSNGDGGRSSTMVGPAGGTVSGPNGAQVVVPGGALSASTPIAITQSSSGAPSLPTGFTAFGPTFAFTPHGTTFSTPVTVTVPFNPGQVPAGTTAALYKSNAQGAWERVNGATIDMGGTATAEVSSFSFFLLGTLPPQITQQPQNATVVEPAAASFMVTALGAPPFTYQWQRSDDQGATFNDVAGATAASYTTPATSLAADNDDRYRVIVSNRDGSSTSQPAVLTVSASISLPTITMHPQDVGVPPGGNATFTVTATGSGVQYQWQRSSDGGASFADIAGATNASYTLANVQAADDDAQFRARVSNSAGSVTSNAARLTVGTAPPPPTTGTRIAAGNGFSLARSANGLAVYSWGTDSGEALGNGPAGDRNLPGPVPLPGFMPQPAILIATGSGARHGLMVSDQVLWGWGYNGFGQLATGTADSQPNPLPATHDNGFVITGATAVSAGTLHTVILRNDGQVFAAGSNVFGQLGDGTNTDRARAVTVANLANVTAVAAGGQFSLALRSDGTVWAWGENSNGQLGDGTLLHRSTPVQVSGLSGAVAIAAGSEHSLALLASGAVVAWGANGEGQLGDNTTVSRSTPVTVLGFSRAFSIAAGGNSSVAMSEVPMIWGSNSNGQLGTGSTTPAFRAVAAPIPTLPTDAFTFAVGGTHVLGLSNDGTVWAWGSNDSGQLGNGTTGGNALAPAQVAGLNLN